LFTIAPPRRSHRMQALSPEHPDVSQPLHTATPEGTPEGSPHQSEVQDISTPPPWVEHTDSLEDFQITNTREDYHIRHGERPFVQLNPSEEAVVTSSESTVGPSYGVVGQDPLWSGDFR
jgi:hypothetical protein